MPRVQGKSGKSRHDPLLVQLDEDEAHARYGRISQPGKRAKSRKSGGNDDETAEVTHRRAIESPFKPSYRSS